ncbi:MAG: hypothetical protein U0230_03045 [Polyangiales bacterium]
MEPNPSIERTYRRVQAGTGLVFASFLFLHLLNVAFALVPGGYDRAQAALRLFYQFPPVEALLAGCLVAHGYVGIRLAIARRKRNERPSRTVRLVRLAGWFLLLAMAGHVGATRISAIVSGHPPGAAGLGFTLEYLPWVFGPYYAALGLLGLLHVAKGLGTAVRMLGPSMRRFLAPADVLGRWMLRVGAPLVVIGLLGLGGILYATPDPFAHPFAGVVRAMVAGVLDVPRSREEHRAVSRGQGSRGARASR